MTRIKPRRIGTPRIVEPGGRLHLWILALALAALIAWTWMSYDLGRQRAGYDSDLAAGKASELKAEIRALKKQREELRLIAANHERAGQIDRDAVRHAQSEIKGLQEERADLRRQVAFLRQLLATNEGPLQIKEFELHHVGNAGYRYRFTVARVQQDDEALDGEIRVAVRGKLQGVARYLPLSELTAGKTAVHKMRFKHFQRVEGTFKLPNEFSPQKFVVEVVPGNKRLNSMQREFDWQVAGA